MGGGAPPGDGGTQLTDPPTGSGPFDAYYFAHGCGRPYQRDDEWLAFFGSIAARIVSDIQPRTVLDAGCAMGFLVEEPRNRNVEPFGLVVSKCVIERMYPDAKLFCRGASLGEQISQRGDNIAGIEVQDRPPPAETKRGSPATAHMLAASSSRRSRPTAMKPRTPRFSPPNTRRSFLRSGVYSETWKTMHRMSTIGQSASDTEPLRSRGLMAVRTEGQAGVMG